ANIYYNAYPSWRQVRGSDCGILAASAANALVADFNADGFMDIVANGEADTGGYRTRIYYGAPDGNFTLDSTYPVIAVNQDGGINMGDWNGDGNMDLIVGGYLGNNDGDIPRYSAPLRVYENRPADAGNTRPEVPASVKAGFADGKIIIEWTDGSDAESPTAALRYNIYVKNETTGELYTMIPADIATGQLKVGTDLQTSLSSRVKRYEMTPLGSGDYTVGVQTLDQSYAPSRFVTARVEGVTHSAISETVDDDSDIRVSLDGLDLTVDTATVAAVKVYTPDGRLAAAGSAPTILSLPAAGLYLVSVTTPSASKSMKIAAR
ncbi:MAG: VCBS repeat-containing protein, partial [Duncaniella sp.]|nr:VCBS repeat-containing protein [Duncaniella sp.]